MCGGKGSQAPQKPAFYGQRFSRSSISKLNDTELQASRIDTIGSDNVVTAQSSYSNGRLAKGTYIDSNRNYIVSDGKSISRYSLNDKGDFGGNFNSTPYAQSFFSVAGRPGSPAKTNEDVQANNGVGSNQANTAKQRGTTRKARRSAFRINTSSGVTSNTQGSGLSIPV